MTKMGDCEFFIPILDVLLNTEDIEIIFVGESIESGRPLPELPELSSVNHEPEPEVPETETPTITVRRR